MPTSLEEVDVVLLAAGRGARLGVLTDATPKPLIPVGERSLLYHNLDQFARFQVRRVIVLAKYRQPDIHAAVGAYRWGAPASEVLLVQQTTPDSEGAVRDGLNVSTAPRTLVRCADDLIADDTMAMLLRQRGAGTILTRSVPDSPLLRLLIAGDQIIGTSNSGPIMTYNFCLDTLVAREWATQAVMTGRPLIESISDRLITRELYAADGANSVGVNYPQDIRTAETWLQQFDTDPR